MFLSHRADERLRLLAAMVKDYIIAFAILQP